MLGLFVACFGGSLFLGEDIFGSNLAAPLVLAPLGPKDAYTAMASAAAYDLNAAANINATCTGQVYGTR